jgi:ubiquinone/menaquinone biosynthesis C-methylase UbiE
MRNTGRENTMSVYERFAKIYDAIGSDRFSMKLFHYTQRLLAKVRYRPHSVLDLACGTGTAAILWKEHNVVTFGIDSSDRMLTVAEKKARARGLDIAFSHQPMTSFTPPQPVDLVTCYFDSLNYLLTMADLAACFRAVHRVLSPDGYFIFDVNTPEAMKVLWDANVYADKTPDVAWIWKNCHFPKAKQAELKAAFFVRKGNVWERFDEVHAERGYTPAEMRTVLKQTGFKVVSIYDCLTFRRPDRHSVRIAVIDRRK